MKRVLIFFYVAGIFLTSCQNQKKESQVDMENPFLKSGQHLTAYLRLMKSKLSITFRR